MCPEIFAHFSPTCSRLSGRVDVVIAWMLRVAVRASMVWRTPDLWRVVICANCQQSLPWSRGCNLESSLPPLCLSVCRAISQQLRPAVAAASYSSEAAGWAAGVAGCVSEAAGAAACAARPAGAWAAGVAGWGASAPSAFTEQTARNGAQSRPLAMLNLSFRRAPISGREGSMIVPLENNRATRQAAGESPIN